MPLRVVAVVRYVGAWARGPGVWGMSLMLSRGVAFYEDVVRGRAGAASIACQVWTVDSQYSPLAFMHVRTTGGTVCVPARVVLLTGRREYA